MQQVITNLLDTFRMWITNFQENLPNILAGIVIFIVSYYLARLLARVLRGAMQRRAQDTETIVLVTRLLRWTVIIFGIVLALQQMGQDVSALLTGLGILGFTVGFALQDVSKNFIAGLLILLQQPFEISDTIQAAGHTGKVLDISLRDTTMQLSDGRQMRIPNADVFTSPVINYTRTLKRRIELGIGVAYESDLDQVKALALETLGGSPGVLAEPKPQAVFHTFGGTAIEGTLYFWMDNQVNDFNEVRSDAITRLNKAFASAGIEMPFPTRAVIVQQE